MNIPTKQAIIATDLPKIVLGVKSPYPTMLNNLITRAHCDDYIP